MRSKTDSGVTPSEGRSTIRPKSDTLPSRDGSPQGISDVRKRLGGRQAETGGEPGADRLKSHRDSLPGSGKLPMASGQFHEGAAGAHVGNLPRGTLPPGRSKAEVRELASQRFPDRWKGGQLNGVVKGASAQNVKLADQYKMAGKGDIARRMQLEKHGAHVANLNVNINVNKYVHHPDHYHGFVGPAYLHHSFEHHYWGPRFFVGVCWYPAWTPWVSWSWNYHCHPIWDPRPIWCRPIIYEPCPVWVYYQPPVWAPLPEATCGTWVDVAPVAVQAQDYNLQLLAVRFVDPGHPEEKQGPRYRMWYRNNSPRPVTQPFNVVLLASNDGRLAPGLPQTGVRVTSIEAGDTQSVDLRLPNDVYTMGRDAQGKPSPYGTVHVCIDAHREIPQSDRANNGATIAVTDVLPVDPAAFELDPRLAVPGGEILLAGEGFGPEAGRALVNVNGQEFDGEILGWYDLGVRLKLPNVALAGPTPAEVIVIRGDSAAANPLKITLTPGQVSAMPPPALPQ